MVGSFWNHFSSSEVHLVSLSRVGRWRASAVSPRKCRVGWARLHYSRNIDGCMKTTTGVVPELEQNFRLHANAALSTGALPPGPRRGARVGAAAGEVRRAALRCEV